MKKCSKCEIEKELIEFNKDSNRKHGLRSHCKKCEAAYYEKNKEVIKSRHKEWRKNNPEYSKNYYKNNLEKAVQRRKDYYKNNKEYHIKYAVDYKRKKLKESTPHKLEHSIRRRFHNWLDGTKKSKRTFEYINCSKEELVDYLESQFYDNPETGEKMTWDNYGLYGWHIDHDKPLFSFDPTSEIDMYEAWRKENLRPLWAKDNLKKGKKH